MNKDNVAALFLALFLIGFITMHIYNNDDYFKDNSDAIRYYDMAKGITSYNAFLINIILFPLQFLDVKAFVIMLITIPYLLNVSSPSLNNNMGVMLFNDIIL